MEQDIGSTRWIVRYKSRVITGGWEESLYSQEENAQGFAADAGEGVSVTEYVPASLLSQKDAYIQHLSDDLARHFATSESLRAECDQLRSERDELLKELGR